MRRHTRWHLKHRDDATEFKSVPFLREPYRQRIHMLPPNGRWLAYVSDESGRDETYVRPFPSATGKWQIPYDGGTRPVWSRNGTELCYVEEDCLMAVPVETAPAFSAVQVAELFADPGLAIQQVAAPQYNVSKDGEQFVLREVVGKVATPIWVVQNWYEEFCDPKGPT